MSTKTVIYYDNEPNYGVNATCVDWSCRNEYFSSMAELRAFVQIEYGSTAELIEITKHNYEQLRLEGVFNV